MHYNNQLFVFFFCSSNNHKHFVKDKGAKQFLLFRTGLWCPGPDQVYKFLLGFQVPTGGFRAKASFPNYSSAISVGSITKPGMCVLRIPLPGIFLALRTSRRESFRIARFYENDSHP